MRTPRLPSVFESPLLVGAAILAVSLVGVVLSYNANKGLPFAPTYEIVAEVPDAAELTAANSEVRVRGARVGLVKDIKAVPGTGGKPAIARLTLSLDPGLANLPIDTEVDVRPRSVLGAKYLEVIPGTSQRTLPQGGRLPISQSRPVVEFDEAFNVFDAQTSEGLRNAISNTGDALAGRGAALNRSVVAAQRAIGPVQDIMRTLSAPSTDLRGFITGAFTVTQALAPVSTTLGALVHNGAVTLAALDVVRGPLGESIEELPPTQTVAISSLHAINPVLDDAAAIARDLRPGTQFLPPATRDLADAVETGTPVLQRTPGLAERLGHSLKLLDDLASDQITNDTVRGLADTIASLDQTVRELHRAQLSCNVGGLYARNLTRGVTEGDTLGTWLNAMILIAPDQMLQVAQPSDNLHINFAPNTDERECEAGNEPFLAGQQIGNPGGRQPAETPDTRP